MRSLSGLWLSACALVAALVVAAVPAHAAFERLQTCDEEINPSGGPLGEFSPSGGPFREMSVEPARVAFAFRGEVRGEARVDLRTDSRSDGAMAQHVIPCAMVDSGLWGPSCDAQFYVLSERGVVLCTVDADALWAAVPDHVLVEAPAGHAAPAFQQVAAVVNDVAALPAPCVTERVQLHDEPATPPLAPSAAPPVPPS